MSRAGLKTYKVLIVDDSRDDRFFLREILNRHERFNLVAELCDGVEAITYLGGTGQFSNREQYPLPELMLLDLKMPRKDGFAVLHWVREKIMPSLTIIVLSSSDFADDIGSSLALGAHGFWTKVADTRRQDVIAQEIEELLDKRWSIGLGKETRTAHRAT